MVCPTGMGLGEALRNTEYGALSFMSQIRPFQGLGLSAKGRYPPALSAPPPSRGRGLWHFVMQHWRHQSKSRNVRLLPQEGAGRSPEDRSESLLNHL